MDNAPGSLIPGLDVVVPGPEGLPARVARTGDNQWLLGLGELAEAPDADLAVTDPGAVAAAAGASACGFLARVELDACGAWVTMACTAELRPLVVRRAGWVDERGDAVRAPDQPWPEDRVGLGPGDAVAVVHRPGDGAAGGAEGVDPVAELLLDHLGSGAQRLVASGTGRRAATGSAALDTEVVAALAVPVEVAGAGAVWVAEATGVPAADLVLPGYPLGDRDPERWRQPPAPPRRATFLLHRDLTRLRALRGVLGRLVSSWRLEDRIDDETLTLLTTELAANALVHTVTAATATITYRGELVRVEVHDGSRELPERREAATDDIGGRGIALIENLAADWGSVATPAGKRTWFDLPVGSPPGGAA